MSKSEMKTDPVCLLNTHSWSYISLTLDMITWFTEVNWVADIFTRKTNYSKEHTFWDIMQVTIIKKKVTLMWYTVAIVRCSKVEIMRYKITVMRNSPTSEIKWYLC